MSLKRSSRSRGVVAQPSKNVFSVEELTAVYLKQRRSVLERALHDQSTSFSRHEELTKPEAYIMENNDKLTIQCRFCGNHMAMTTLPFQLFPPSEGGEAKTVESRDAAVQVDLLNAGDRGRNAAGDSAGPGLDGYLWPGSPTAQNPSPGYAMAGCSIAGRPTAKVPPAFLMDPSVAFRSSTHDWNSMAGTSAGTQVTQWGSSSLHGSVSNELQESKQPPAAAVRSASPIFISSSSSASCSPSSSPNPHHSGLNSSTNATSSTCPPAPAPHSLHPTLPCLTSSPPPESSPSLSLLPLSSFLASPPPNLKIHCLNEEEAVDLTPPPGLIAPLSPRLAEEEENEEESPRTAPSPGPTQAARFQCSVCDKDMKTKQRLLVHFRVHTGERPYKCELCSAAFAQSANHQYHMKRKHPLAIYKPIKGKALKTSKNVAPATVVTSSPSAAANASTSDGFEPAGKSLTEQALDAATDSKLAVPRNIDIRGAHGTNTAKASVCFKEASDAPADSKQAGCDSTDIDSITASARETNVANIANDMEVNPIMDANDITEATKQNDFKEVANDVKEVVSDVTEVANDVKEVVSDVTEVANDFKGVANDVEEVANDVKGVANDVEEVANDVKKEANNVEEVANDVKKEANDVEEVANDVTEEANDVTKVVSDVKEEANDVKGLGDVKDINTVVDGTILVETRRCRRNNLEQGKDFFCLECLECFPTEEHLMNHEEEKHPLGDQQEADDDVNRNPEQFAQSLRWKSEEDLLALSPDSEPMSAAEDQMTSLTAKQGRASSPEVPVKKAAGKRKARSPKNKRPKREAPTPASGEAPPRSRPRKVPEHAENYWTRIRMKAVASASPSQRVTRQNSPIKPMRDAPRRRTKPTSTHTDTPARQTDTPERQTDTVATQKDTSARQTDTPDKQAERPAKRMCSLIDKRGRPTNTLVGEAVVLQQVQARETNNEPLAGLKASGEEGHAGLKRRETHPMSEALERVRVLDGNIQSSLKPCSVRLVCLYQPTP